MPMSTDTAFGRTPNVRRDSQRTKDQSIEVHLRRRWAYHCRRLALSGAGWILGVLGMLIAVDLLLDWWLDLPGYARLLLLAANLVALACVAWHKLGGHLRRFDMVDQALGVERAAPQLGGLLISGVQFEQQEKGDRRAEETGVSVQLIRAVKRQAHQKAQSLDWSQVAPRVPLKWGMLSAVAAMVIVGSIAVWDARFLHVLTVRMFNPTSALAYPTDTIIELNGGDKVVRAGDPVTLSAQTHGVVPEAGMLHVRFEGLDWEKISLTGDKGAFKHVLPRATDDLQFYFHLGDARSMQHQVTVVRPPRIVDRRVRLQTPEYTNLGEQEVRTLNIRAPEGTHLRWRLKLDKPVTAAEMRLEGGGTRMMTVGSQGREISLDLAATASQPYIIAMHWTLENQTYIDEGPRHYIQIVPDTDPQVSLLSPTEDTKATLRKTIPIAYWARDDHSLDESVIVYSVNDGGELRRELPTIVGKHDTEETVDWPITQLLPTLRLGDIVTFAVEVTDGRPDSPGKTRSISRRVQFVSDSEYAAYILSRQRKTLGRLRPIYKQQREAAQQLRGVSTKP